MVPWRIYQQIAAELDVSPETMHLINVLADGGYLTENQPPYLNLITNSITSSNGETDSGRSFPTQPSDDSFSLERLGKGSYAGTASFTVDATGGPTMTFQERLRAIEERYDVSQSEHARELGRTVADLQD